MQCGRPGFNTWIVKIPWRREWLPTSLFLSGESHGQRSLVGYSLWGCKESDTTEWLILSHSFWEENPGGSELPFTGIAGWGSRLNQWSHHLQGIQDLEKGKAWDTLRRRVGRWGVEIIVHKHWSGQTCSVAGPKGEKETKGSDKVGSRGWEGASSLEGKYSESSRET